MVTRNIYNLDNLMKHKWITQKKQLHPSLFFSFFSFLLLRKEPPPLLLQSRHSPFMRPKEKDPKKLQTLFLALLPLFLSLNCPRLLLFHSPALS